MSELHPSWVDIGAVEDFLSQKSKAIVVQGCPILVITQGSEIYAILNRCSHEDLPLTDGEFEDDVIICPFHGAKFCFKTGAHLAPPAFSDLTAYPVKILNNRLLIKIQ